jgi:maleylpyruvate isomerase
MRGHVLTHLARGGEAIGRLLAGIRTGVPGQAYAGQQERDEAVERGAGRGAAELVADLTESAARFRDAATGVPADAWDRSARGLVGDPFPARQLLQRRLVELELHHADLDAGYTTRNGRRSSPAWTWPSPCAVSGRSVGAGGAVALRMS